MNMDEVLSQIKNEIENNDIVLFLKGTANMPQCGFSGVVVQILNRLELPFKDINILESEELRQGIKEFSNWPTIPQLYIKQEFIGGCDIVREMYLSGQLQNLLQEKGLK
ncbi:putative monothiol glutaredoxin-2 [Candidatus Jidaibacter acanthamoeba]|uniref:Glutaredoxin n=1 Tax=Candidatus Jidaibacter acanthamoebae TaxID=86105 RepID=A0A0C1QGS2_9RICK|nr:Grx4 family monothiol glutaredoxin [Candidatus Jidaibacter acanthamoeba]KIE04769.1 putative monothiol glutaredoxin-2 [Candidatus Jidaibacter acanthamoeba]